MRTFIKWVKHNSSLLEMYVFPCFFKDDKEYIGTIKEKSEWGSGHYLRKLFVIMLLSGTISRPCHVWNNT